MEKKIKPSPRKHKNRVHPSSSTLKTDALSVLKLLPATILALAFALSLQDREVLAYMISRSMKTKNPICNGSSKKSPDFKCGCFDCYSSYWLKWDSSPDKDVILQAIEAFEEHLGNTEISKIKNGGHAAEKETKLGEIYVDALEKIGPVEQEEKECRSEKMAVNVNPVRFPACGEKGIARKFLPDVSDFLNPRLYSLWMSAR